MISVNGYLMAERSQKLSHGMRTRLSHLDGHRQLPEYELSSSNIAQNPSYDLAAKDVRNQAIVERSEKLIPEE